MLAVELLPDQEKCKDKIIDIYDGKIGHCKNGALLCTRYGSGKSLISILAAQIIRQRAKQAGPIPIVTPLSPMADLVQTCQMHFDPPLKVFYVKGRSSGKYNAHLHSYYEILNYDILVINYESLTNMYEDTINHQMKLMEEANHPDLEEFRADPKLKLDVLGPIKSSSNVCHVLFQKKWPVIIIDEVHEARNMETSWFTSLINLQADFRLALSATPFNNKIEDIISLLRITGITSSLFASWDKSNFSSQEEYCREISTCRDLYMIREQEDHKIRDHYKPVDIVIRCEFLTEQERRFYTGICEDTVSEMFKGQSRQQQACSGIYYKEDIDRMSQATLEDTPPSLIQWHIEQEDSTKYILENATKIKMTLQYLLVPITRNEKAVIFCAHRASVRSLERHINQVYPRVRTFTANGDLSASDRNTIRRDFTKCSSSAVLIVTDIFNQGVNLHCNHTIMFDIRYNPVVTDQSRSRCERPTQILSVFTVQLLIANSIEDQIWEIAQGKRIVNDQVMFKTITPTLLVKINSINAATTIRNHLKEIHHFSSSSKKEDEEDAKILYTLMQKYYDFCFTEKTLSLLTSESLPKTQRIEPLVKFDSKPKDSIRIFRPDRHHHQLSINVSFGQSENSRFGPKYYRSHRNIPRTGRYTSSSSSTIAPPSRQKRPIIRLEIDNDDFITTKFQRT